MTQDCIDTGAVWSELSSDLRRYIRRRVRDDPTADDLLQETFVRIHRGLGTVRGRDRLAAWVYRVAENVVVDHYRRRSLDAISLDAQDAVSDDPSDHFRFGATQWMGELIDQLPKGYRDAVRLCEIDGLSQQQVAERLAISLSGAKSRIQRGRRLLKQILTGCCDFLIDRRGRIVDCEPRPNRQVCLDCDR